MAARLPKTRAALAYARRQHAGQVRSSDGAAFIEHPAEVGWLLYRAGAADHVVAAGVLHDVLEKTAVGVAELRAGFGPAIAELVTVVSEDERIERYGPRKAALRRQVAAAGPEAMMIFAADKISRARELRASLATAGRGNERFDQSLLRPRRLAHLHHCLGMLEERLGGASLVVLLRAELGELDHELRASAVTRAVA